jgi:hypothetical protein
MITRISHGHKAQFLGALRQIAKKATISFIMSLYLSVRLSVRAEQLGFH